MATVNGTPISQSYYNGGWINYSPDINTYAGTNYNNFYTYILKFKAPTFTGVSDNLTIKLGMTRLDLDSPTLRYALCTSDTNKNSYLNTNKEVSDLNQITSGTVKIGATGTQVTYHDIPISTPLVESGKEYYLFLWGYEPQGSSGCIIINPIKYHTITMTTCTHSEYVYGGEDGVHTKCKKCGTTLSTNHTYNVDSGVQHSVATCTTKRKNYLQCSCGYNPKSASYVVETGNVNPSNHTGSIVNGGTADVHTKYSCCGVTVSSTHSYTSSVQIDATCTTKGTTKYTCSCGYFYTAQDIPLKSHSYTSTVVSPTCTEQGYTKHVCSVCGDSYKDTYTDALGHNYVGNVTIEPTYTSEGVMTYTCSRCNDSYTEVIPKKEGGLVYIDNGTSFDAYQAYIDNGISWDLYIPYIDNGSSWDMCT